MILFSVLIFSTKFLDSLILNLTYIFLEGSSEGKSVLLFGIMGSILLLYPLFNNNGKIMQKISSLNPAFKGNGNMYLKLAIIIVLLTYLIGILIEITFRLKLGVSILTTFVAMDPSPASTSITHSHVFKSVLGDLISLVRGLCSRKHTHRHRTDTIHLSIVINSTDNLSTDISTGFNINE